MSTSFKEPQEKTELVPLELSPDLWASEYVFEVRYQPNARVLDHRGKFADQLSRHMELPEWLIDTSRIDVFSKDEKTRVFVGFRNVGMVLMDSPSGEYFRAQSEKFLRWLFRQTEVGSNLNVERIGVRLRFGVSFNGTFEELLDRIATRYFQIPESARAAIGNEATLMDIGAVLNWKDKLGTFNTTLGPMVRKELSNQFKRGEENPPPEVGLYYDIDGFRKPNRELMGIEIVSSINKFVTEASERYQRIRDLIFK